MICLATGRVRAKSGSRGVRRYLADDWRDEALPVNVFLIERAEGLCLFDTGQTARAAAPGWFPRWHPFFRLARFELTPADEVEQQLRALGVEPTAVGTVVLSHLHTDHIGGLDAFTHAEVLVTRSEWEHAQGLRGRLRGYLPQYWPSGLVPTLIDFDRGGVGPFTSSYDVSGDGRLLLIPLPGHSPGHCALLARGDRRSWLLVGDAAHTAAEFALAEPAVAAWCAAEDVAVLAAHDPRAAQLL